MLKTGYACLRGHRMEMYLIRLWQLLCWLLPVVAELLVRRILPPAWLAAPWGTAGLLCGSFFLNRMLIAPAHCGYAACCYRLALGGSADMATTCELAAWRDSAAVVSLPRLFFREYRHPLFALRRQLRWDFLRLLAFAASLFPGLLLIAVGARDDAFLWQTAFGIGGVLLTLLGALLMWLFLRRFLPAVYLRHQYPTLFSAVTVSLRRTRRRFGSIAACQLLYLVSLPLLLCPFLLCGTAFDVAYAVFWQRLPTAGRQRHLFRTRILDA